MCNIPRLFLRKKYWNYHTFHSNHLGISSIYYEIETIKVILPQEEIYEIFVLDEDNNKEINVGQNGILFFITNYKDNEQKIFVDDIYIEEKTEFKTTIVDENSNNYEVICR